MNNTSLSPIQAVSILTITEPTPTAHSPLPTKLRHQTRGQLTLQVEAGLGGEAGVGAEAGGGRGAADRQRGHLGQAAQHEARHGEAGVAPHLHRGHSEDSAEASVQLSATFPSDL